MFSAAKLQHKKYQRQRFSCVICCFVFTAEGKALCMLRDGQLLSETESDKTAKMNTEEFCSLPLCILRGDLSLYLQTTTAATVQKNVSAVVHRRFKPMLSKDTVFTAELKSKLLAAVLEAKSYKVIPCAKFTCNTTRRNRNNEFVLFPSPNKRNRLCLSQSEKLSCRSLRSPCASKTF